MRRLAFAASVLVACSRPSPVPPAPMVTADDLWRLAPTGSRSGAVITGGAIANLRETIGAVATSLRRSPTPALADQLRAVFVYEGIDFLAPGGPAGLELARGLALFEIDGALVVFYPARDPAAFGKTRRGQICRPHAGYAACSTAATALDHLGGSEAATAAAARPAHLRGSVEVVIASSRGSVTGAVDAPRGTLDVRFAVDGASVPAGFGPTTPSPLTERALAAPASGVLVIDVRTLRPMVAQLSGDPSIAALVAALRGDLAAVTLAGDAPRAWIAIGLADPAVARAILDRCGELATPQVTARAAGGRCTITPNVPLMPLPSVEARIEGDLAIIETAGAYAVRGTAAPEIAPIVAAPAYLATWGRGMSWRTAVPVATTEGEMAHMQWAIDRIDELALAFRSADRGVEASFRIGTTWRNPDDVVAKLDAALAFDRAPAVVATDLARIAKEHPSSPLARSLALGPSGPLLPVATLGMAAAVAIPAFMEYMRRSREAAAAP